MRILANENVPRALIAALEEAGHEVTWVRTAAPGKGDGEVLAWAGREERIQVTFDKDFGELAGRASMPATCGVILFRLPAPKSIEAGRRLAGRIGARDDWVGHFSVIEPGRVRMRPLP
jgi:predicted nuclease of predicted toxin-antitoxin system